jgi:hypothetical protein
MRKNGLEDKLVFLRPRGIFAKINPSFILAAIAIAVVLWQPGCKNDTQAPEPGPEPPIADPAGPRYDIGSPSLTDIWVDPAGGSDGNSGNSRSQPLKTMRAAWEKVPSGATLKGNGYRLQLLPGTYPAYDQADANIPGQFSDRFGSFTCPVVIQSADGINKAMLPGLEVFNCRYIYFIDLNTRGASSGGDGFHISSCDHVLIRNCDINGNGQTQEVLKGNQCRHVYVEDSHIHGPTDNVGLDFVAVQYGHICRNRIHDVSDWGMYLKGGSAYFRIEANELFNAGNGGFTAGQGSGFEYMVDPWLHYEAYDIKFVNNVVHDTDGAGMGVNGGYNILLAYNTLYRVGRISHAVEIVFGGRGCGGDASHLAAAKANHDAGGWGRAVAEESQYYIPNRNVFIYDNIICNPPPYQSQWNHFASRGDTRPASGSNAPDPCRGDANLQIKGNFIWNGPADLPLGIGAGGEARLDTAAVRSQNSINQSQPQLADPAAGDFRPLAGGNVFSATAVSIPDFAWGDAPARPEIPPGAPSNMVAINHAGEDRDQPGHPGAY